MSQVVYKYPDCRITINSSTTVTVEFGDTSYFFDDKDKPIFDAGTGESVIEFTGLSVDQNPDRSWAKAVYCPKGRSRPHFHSEHTEDYYIIAGQARVVIDTNILTLNAGDYIKITPNQVHQVFNPSSHEELKLIVKCVPAWSYEDFNLVHQINDMAHQINE